jgi:mRNA interferase RelE/StbE
VGRDLVIGKKAQEFIVSLPEAMRKKIKEAMTRLVAGDVRGWTSSA